MNTLGDNPSSSGSYILGHAAQEIERLGTQARLIDPTTRQFLRDAGIVPGMRVLDVGCGAGAIAFLAADLVGEAGEVIGVDRAPAALVAARAQAAARALHNISFREGDPTAMAFEQPFDAIVGRYVLMFVRDPPAMLGRLAGHLRAGGVMAFHELDWEGARSFPPAPTYDQCCRWIVETYRLHGTEARMGIKLYTAFVAAGLPAPSMRLEAIVGGGVHCAEFLHRVADLVGTLLPEMERLGVATAAEVCVETLADRISKEARASVIVGYSEIGAWSRVS